MGVCVVPLIYQGVSHIPRENRGRSSKLKAFGEGHTGNAEDKQVLLPQTLVRRWILCLSCRLSEAG